eukprot:3744084-Rhodomonas_salina.1
MTRPRPCDDHHWPGHQPGSGASDGVLVVKLWGKNDPSSARAKRASSYPGSCHGRPVPESA